MTPQEPEQGAPGERAADGPASEPSRPRLATLRAISPLVASEQEWVDSDFVAARIWTE